MTQEEWLAIFKSVYPEGMTPEQEKWVKTYELIYVDGMEHFIKRLKGEPSKLPDNPEVFRTGWEDALLSVNTFYKMYGFAPTPKSPGEDYEKSVAMERFREKRITLWKELYGMVRKYQIQSGIVTITREKSRLRRRDADYENPP